ncbi:hypothetical protein K490DRAFT_72221 [Saccharata proteae CBS 121410]|uniref:Zincin n=1 Tax=Saccharata proteae CBS 121410 TaxID=1314787 RepID=A0A6A5YC36_9PEZI|nr:hypothetical protein K490DRAFT_72221 [Saccharata proteae CBS 121410]
MSPKTQAVSVAALALSLAISVSAVPTKFDSRSLDRTLFPRLDVNFVGCTDDQKTKLKTDFADAAALANIAYGQIDESGTAYTHYLRGQDSDKAKSFWSMVAANNDPTNAPYTLAITDAQPQTGSTPREMLICPLYFTASVTANNLNSKKYDGDKRGSWCQSGQKFKDFETGGHTLLHEMTHLDALGAAAGEPLHDGVHGTDDVDGYGDDYTVAARAFLNDWVNDPGSLPTNALKPYQNAENLAASATENWFLLSCGFTNIDL